MKSVLAIISFMAMGLTAHANDCKDTVIKANQMMGVTVKATEFSVGKSINQVLAEHGLTAIEFRNLPLEKQVALFVQSQSIQAVAANTLTDLQIQLRKQGVLDLSAEGQKALKNMMTDLILCMQ